MCAVGAVAEMTGRRGRVVADGRGRGVYQLRAKPDSTEMDSLNVSETGVCAFCGVCTTLYESVVAESIHKRIMPVHESLDWQREFCW